MDGIPMSKNLIENLRGILNNKIHVHHLHINGEIIGYAHSYRSQKEKISQKSV